MDESERAGERAGENQKISRCPNNVPPGSLESPVTALDEGIHALRSSQITKRARRKWVSRYHAATASNPRSPGVQEMCLQPNNRTCQESQKKSFA